MMNRLLTIQYQLQMVSLQLVALLSMLAFDWKWEYLYGLVNHSLSCIFLSGYSLSNREDKSL